MKKLTLLLIPLIFLSGCTVSEGTTSESETVNQTIERLQTAEPLPNLTNSLERRNISKRLTAFEDENKVSYIYLVSYGKVMAFYPVKGKVSSGSKRLTQEDRLVMGEYGQGYGDFVMEAPSLDGTYGSSSDYIFFWTTEGAYIQWNGEYMLADQPLKLTTQPELVREIK